MTSTPLCPEVRLHLAADLAHLWHAQESWFERRGLPPPFWGVAWVGGQALARYVLDHPEFVRNRTVLDIGSGSGLCAIAAAKAGAGLVEAADVDPFSLKAISANAALNGVRVATVQADLIGSASRWDVILAGDLWYERFLAQCVTSWLRQMAKEGTIVLLGDSRRAFFPRGAMVQLERYAIQPPGTLENGPKVVTEVWKMA